jgi:hypothetical protein
MKNLVKFIDILIMKNKIYKNRIKCYLICCKIFKTLLYIYRIKNKLIFMNLYCIFLNGQ